MTLLRAVHWFVTQPVASLTNTISRTYLQTLLDDDANALSELTERVPLYIATQPQVNALETVTTSYTGILARLNIDWSNALELFYLAQIVAAVTPSLTPAQQYAAAVTALAPLLWYQMDEAATPAVNYGSIGSAANGTVTNMGAFRQATGLAAIPYAYDYNGSNSHLAVPNNAGLASANFTVACLTSPDTAGEGTTGAFFEGMTAAFDIVVQWRFNSAVTAILAQVRNTAGGAFSTITTTGISAGAYAWLFMQYNDTTKKCNIWKSASGTLTEFAYSAQPALTGTARQFTMGTTGNNLGGTFTFDGKYAQFLSFGSLLTTVQMQSIITTSGVV